MSVPACGVSDQRLGCKMPAPLAPQVGSRKEGNLMRSWTGKQFDIFERIMTVLLGLTTVGNLVLVLEGHLWSIIPTGLCTVALALIWLGRLGKFGERR